MYHFLIVELAVQKYPAHICNSFTHQVVTSCDQLDIDRVHQIVTSMIDSQSLWVLYVDRVCYLNECIAANRVNERSRRSHVRRSN